MAKPGRRPGGDTKGGGGGKADRHHSRHHLGPKATGAGGGGRRPLQEVKRSAPPMKRWVLTRWVEGRGVGQEEGRQQRHAGRQASVIHKRQATGPLPAMKGSGSRSLPSRPPGETAFQMGPKRDRIRWVRSGTGCTGLARGGGGCCQIAGEAPHLQAINISRARKVQTLDGLRLQHVPDARPDGLEAPIKTLASHRR